MGATQFALLYALGIRSTDRLLDIGCGSLRAGRMIIPYLDAGNYTGLDPNKWLIDQALEKEIGLDVLTMKSPTFVHNDSFDVDGLDPFDFVLAQSIASHTGPTMTRALLRCIRTALKPTTGMAAVTFVNSYSPDNTAEGWFYPECVCYRPDTVRRWIQEAGLNGTPIPWFHPYQTWWLLVPEQGSLPNRRFIRSLRGVNLSEDMRRTFGSSVRQSWYDNRLRAYLASVAPHPLKEALAKLRSTVKST